MRSAQPALGRMEWTSRNTDRIVIEKITTSELRQSMHQTDRMNFSTYVR
jgi:hypothetical protein